MIESRRQFLQRVAWVAGLATLLPSRLLAALPKERIHVVQPGDNLAAIAAAHGTSVTALRSRNQLESDRIIVGQRLIIPSNPAGALPAHNRTARANVRTDLLAPVIAANRGLKIEPGRWTHLVIHHSGIEAGNAKAYDSAHRRRGMTNGLAYHFVIGNGRDSGDGQIEIGPRWTNQILGGHVRSPVMNEHGIGICLVGNFENRPPGARQMEALHALIAYLRGPGLPGDRPARVTVHRWVDRNHTVCPGRRFPYDELRRRYSATASG